MFAWIALIVAGLLEVAWAIGLKYTDGFTRPVPSVLTGAAMVGSMFLLSRATQTIPLGTAYGIWVGIGAAGAAVAGWALFDEPLTLARGLCVVLLIGAVVGLKLTSPVSSG